VDVDGLRVIHLTERKSLQRNGNGIGARAMTPALSIEWEGMYTDLTTGRTVAVRVRMEQEDGICCRTVIRENGDCLKMCRGALGIGATEMLRWIFEDVA
jgi:hypothetical protein